MEAVRLLMRLLCLPSTTNPFTAHFAIILHHILADKAVGVVELDVFQGLKEDLLLVLLLREIVIIIIVGFLFKV